MAKNIWYLGLDLGNEGLTAVLSNPERGDIPLSWLYSEQEKKYAVRFPMNVYCGPGVGANSPSSPFVVGIEALKFAQQKTGIFLDDLKSLLKITLPYYLPEQHQWQPQLQLQPGEGTSVSLYLVQRGLQALLTTLTTGEVRVGNYSAEAVKEIMTDLQGVFVSCPAIWSEAYRFNVREAILGAKLVKEPGRVIFLEDAIASCLGSLSTHQKAGITLVIHISSLTTEFALLRVPEELTALDPTDIWVSTYPYGGKGLDEDIFWQLLYPHLVKEQESLFLEAENIPQPGQPDQEHRYLGRVHFQKYLGKSALQAAQLVKHILQKQNHFTPKKLGNGTWTVKRKNLEYRVTNPFIEALNQELNHLLSQAGISGSGVTQVILSGGATLAILPCLKTWLGQKLMNAELIELTPDHNPYHLAKGLASLPQFSQVFNRSRHQYNDYFLLCELLNLSEEVLTFEEILQQLEQRGINTRACHDPYGGVRSRIQALITGEFPPGLVPDPSAHIWLTQESQNNLIYQEIMASPLFTPEGKNRYRLNCQQKDRLCNYLNLILVGTWQNLAEPLNVQI